MVVAMNNIEALLAEAELHAKILKQQVDILSEKIDKFKADVEEYEAQNERITKNQNLGCRFVDLKEWSRL